MYVLDFLSGFPDSRQSDEMVAFEYRLLCSGELFNGSVETADWRKGTAARMLLDAPFSLIVCSYPFNAFPQEMALRFSASSVTERSGLGASLFYPDEDIARDLAALLTLLCRRLITVAAKIREQHPGRQGGDPPVGADWPIGFVTELQVAHWQFKPSVVVYGPEGIRGITDYNPPPLGVDPDRLRRILTGLPKLPFAESFVLTARLYASALEQLEHDVEVSYQLLIAAAEAMANAVLSDFRPDAEDMISAKKSVADMAVKFGLSKEQSQQIAIEASRGIGWARRKFCKFLMDNTTDQLHEEDDLFRVPPQYLPETDALAEVLQNVYKARGMMLHTGRGFDMSSVIGIGPRAPARALLNIDPARKPFPPVVWFERVVNCALNRFIERALPADDASGQNWDEPHDETEDTRGW